MARVTWLVASVQISISCWRRSSSVMMPRSYWLSTLAASPSNFSSSPAFGRRRRDVGDRDRQPGARRPLVAEGLQLVEAVGDDRLVVDHDELTDDLGDVALLHRRVDEREVVGERGVEQEPAERRLDQHLGRAVAAVLAQHDALRRAVLERAAGSDPTGNLLAGIRTLIFVCSDTRLARGRVALLVRGDAPRRATRSTRPAPRTRRPAR